MENNELTVCSSCGHSVPIHNINLHQAICQRTQESTIIDCSSGLKEAEEPMIDLTDDYTNAKSVVDLTDYETSPPPCPHIHRAPSCGNQYHLSSHADVISNMHVEDRAAQCKDDGTAGSTDEEGEGDIQIQCQSCTYHNPPHVDVCQMCITPLGRGDQGRRQNGARASSGHATDAATRTWTCPLCTFQNPLGQWMCEACHVGRPRRQDMIDYQDEMDDGFVVVPPTGAGRGARRQQQGGGSYLSRTFEGMLSGAMVGAGIGGVGSALAGESPSDTRRRMVQGMLMGGIGGGLLGHFREYMALEQMQSDAIDHMSYEDLLNLFGSGNTPQKASAEAVQSLPEEVVDENDLARLSRESSGGGPGTGESAAAECCICMEKYEKGDVIKRLVCLHPFHKACIERWLLQSANRCPICKMTV